MEEAEIGKQSAQDPSAPAARWDPARAWYGCVVAWPFAHAGLPRKQRLVATHDLVVIPLARDVGACSQQQVHVVPHQGERHDFDREMAGEKGKSIEQPGAARWISQQRLASNAPRDAVVAAGVLVVDDVGAACCHAAKLALKSRRSHRHVTSPAASDRAYGRSSRTSRRPIGTGRMATLASASCVSDMGKERSCRRASGTCLSCLSLACPLCCLCYRHSCRGYRRRSSLRISG